MHQIFWYKVKINMPLMGSVLMKLVAILSPSVGFDKSDLIYRREACDLLHCMPPLLAPSVRGIVIWYLKQFGREQMPLSSDVFFKLISSYIVWIILYNDLNLTDLYSKGFN